MPHARGAARTRVESMMVLRRCAMVRMVLSAKLLRMAAWMKASVSPSTLAVASSSTSTLGLHRSPPACVAAILSFHQPFHQPPSAQVRSVASANTHTPAWLKGSRPAACMELGPQHGAGPGRGVLGAAPRGRPGRARGAPPQQRARDAQQLPLADAPVLARLHHARLQAVALRGHPRLRRARAPVTIRAQPRRPGKAAEAAWLSGSGLGSRVGRPEKHSCNSVRPKHPRTHAADLSPRALCWRTGAGALTHPATGIGTTPAESFALRSASARRRQAR